MARRKVQKDELVEDYKRVAEELGKLPTLQDYNEHGEYTQIVIYRVFGSVKDLREVAGLRRGDYKYTNEELIKDLKRVGDIVGREPRLLEYEEHGEYSTDTLLTRLGGNWGSALEAAGFEPKGHAAAFNGNRKPSIERNKGMEIVCDWCGETATISRIDADDSQRKFCSPECRSKWQSDYYSGLDGPIAGEQIEVTCAQCGKIELKPPSLAGPYRFCSLECRHRWESENWKGPGSPKWNRVTKVCEICEEEFQAWPSIAERIRFCSYECMGKWRSETQRGENNPRWKEHVITHYGSSWYVQRRRCLERDDYQCLVCGRGKEELGVNPDVHHIKKFQSFISGDNVTDEEAAEANKLDNLVTLCRDHHQVIEGMGLLPSDVADAMAD